MAATAADEWTEVKTHKRPAKPWMSQSKCEDLERKLNIRNLAKTLMSKTSKDLQAQGFKFDKVIPEAECKELLLTRNPLTTAVLSTSNKWRDFVVLTREIEEDDGPECVRCGDPNVFRRDMCPQCYYRDEENDQ